MLTIQSSPVSHLKSLNSLNSFDCFAWPASVLGFSSLVQMASIWMPRIHIDLWSDGQWLSEDCSWLSFRCLSRESWGRQLHLTFFRCDSGRGSLEGSSSFHIIKQSNFEGKAKMYSSWLGRGLHKLESCAGLLLSNEKYDLSTQRSVAYAIMAYFGEWKQRCWLYLSWFYFCCREKHTKQRVRPIPFGTLQVVLLSQARSS